MRHCYEYPPDELLTAIEEFNRGDWFECHETLEDLWVGEELEMRDFYQGLLQVAVALHHWKSGNLAGALLLLERGASLLRRVPPVCQRLDVASLIVAADHFREVLKGLGADAMVRVDASLIPKLRLVSTAAQERTVD